MYYCYSHIFPDSWAQHCNYATLLAGRCGNKLWYSVIVPMGTSFLSMLVFTVRVIGFLCQRCIYFSGLYLATSSDLYLSFSLPRCGCLYRLEIFCNGVNLWSVLRSSCFTSVGLGVSTESKNLLLLHMSTPLPVHCVQMHLDPKGGLIAEGFCPSTIYMRSFSIHELCASTCLLYCKPVV